MMNFKKLNDLTGWIVFAIATLVYFLTLEPTASWWDCGEYIATAYKLQVGHPPGAPLFQMIGRFFSLFAFGDVMRVALMINVMSALSSSFTILFLFWTITLLARKIMMRGDDENNRANQIAVLGAGVVGALAYTFTESFWFSAGEGEVYAMSSFFTALVFWAILKWERVAEEPHSNRWLLFIAYLIGLSIGVHMLNLLAIPAVVYVYYFKKYKPNFKGFFFAGMISVAILGFIMSFIIPWIIRLAGDFELLFVNSFGAPFNVGTIVYFALLIAAIIFGIYFTHKKGKVVLNTVILAFMFILIGYSSFFMLVIRANANTPINENTPSDAISLLSYMNRDQYGSWPLFYGTYYNAPRTAEGEDGTPVYVKDKEKGKYVITDSRKGALPTYDKRFETLFPRMWANSPLSEARKKMYDSYVGNKGIPVRVDDGYGNSSLVYKPTFGQNLRFFFDYQLNQMYFRYFMWNFVGRQNDIESQGEIENGNWISGINALDSARLGDQKDLPRLLQNPARTAFYFLPLLLGILGIVFLLNKDLKDSWIVFLLFFMTGIAIIVYLNQQPYQPRERDYAYAGSFYAFAIWIGFGVLYLFEWLSKVLKNKKVTAVLVSVASLILVPGIMAASGWEGHNRAGKFAARDFARNYLIGLQENAIIFSHGDNDTFPLWYVQEVENFRTDVRVANYMLASSYWYVHQMGKQVYESERFPLSLNPKQYENGVNEIVYVNPIIEGPIELKEVIDFIKSDHPQTKLRLSETESVNFIPTTKIKLTVDKEAVIRGGTVPEHLHDQIVDVIYWDIKTSGLYKNDLMLLDLVSTNNWERAIYFTSSSASSKVFDIDKYSHLEGIVYKFMPVPAKHHMRSSGGISVDETYNILVNQAKWGNLNDPKVTIDRESMRNHLYAKFNYMRLAMALLEEGKNDSAVAVLDKYIEFFPDEKIPFDANYMSTWADSYYKAGYPEKGDAVIDKIFKNQIELITYYNNQASKFYKYYMSKRTESFNNMLRLVYFTYESGARAKADEIAEALFDCYANKYREIIGSTKQESHYLALSEELTTNMAQITQTVQLSDDAMYRKLEEKLRETVVF
ncbi:MAG: DUF2723 domain-containing protein [Lentimicrobiaceae bacterium]|jgi:tetratricopeptide (TPR) repeat protein|nr:DUF2723 domain-containing protein [Lentimicrobiaceae bacterium]